MRTNIILLIGLLAGVVATGACNKSEETQKQPTAAKAAPKPVSAEAKEAFSTRCASCHGPEGKGNGPASAALNPKPRNYTDKTWQKSVTDEQIKKTILMGGAAVGKSPIMPASPDLESQPQLLDGLVALIRNYGS